MREFVRVFDDCFNRLVVADFECLGDDGCDLSYDLPNSLTYGQFLCVLTNIPEQPPDGFIVGEPTRDGEYIVLQERDSGVRDLSSTIRQSV